MPNRALRSRFTLYLLGLALLIDISLLIVAGLSARHYLHQQLRQRLMAAAAAGALMVDAEALTHIRSRSDEGNAIYRQLQQRLRALRNATPGTRYIYALRPAADPTRWQFIVDAEENPKLVSHPGDLYDTSNIPEMWKGLSGPAADREPAADAWGSWLSGYAPIRDASGKTVALLGVDMSASLVAGQEAAPVRAVLVAAVGLLVLALLVSVHLGAALWRPVAALTEATRHVAAGDLSVRVNPGRPSELSQLGQAFNAMTTSLRRRERRLREESCTDFLTSLHNHRAFQEQLDGELARASYQHHPLALVMLDVDHFRRVNSSHGHQGGDDLLRELAGLMQRGVREQDLLTRYGGEEFALILPETTSEQAWALAERLREAVEKQDFKIRSLGNPIEISVTISAGAASYPCDALTKDELVVAADAALLRAKSISRNRACRFSAEDARKVGHWDLPQLHLTPGTPPGATVRSFAQALDPMDNSSRGHAEYVTRIALALAQSLGLPSHAQMTLRVAGLLHDIGKAGVPDEVLDKTAPLSPEEWEMLRAHPLLGAQLLSQMPKLAEAIPIVKAHHERYDGGGYPEGLAGGQIPLAARILALADAYAAMTSERPYRKALTQQEALAELRANQGTQFDPAVVHAFEALLRDASAGMPIFSQEDAL